MVLCFFKIPKEYLHIYIRLTIFISWVRMRAEDARLCYPEKTINLLGVELNVSSSSQIYAMNSTIYKCLCHIKLYETDRIQDKIVYYDICTLWKQLNMIKGWYIYLSIWFSLLMCVCVFISVAPEWVVVWACYIAKVIALYKKKCAHFAENYRPISLLSCIDKIFEKLLHKRFMDLIVKHKITILEQYGFLPKWIACHN